LARNADDIQPIVHHGNAPYAMFYRGKNIVHARRRDMLPGGDIGHGRYGFKKQKYYENCRKKKTRPSRDENRIDEMQDTTIGE
ncbi:hypothetical protein T4A_6243, partial [Trichinella pseudospiralis]